MKSCDMAKHRAKVKLVKRQETPLKRFRPLFKHALALAMDSARSGYCQRAGREIAHARKVARYR